MTTIRMTPFSVGAGSYQDLPAVCRDFNVKKAVVIGGERALAQAADQIYEAITETEVTLTGTFVYGTECTMENVEALRGLSEVREADTIFAVGGGKAIDTCKTLAFLSGKRIFTFPTISSNCAAGTGLSVIYHPDGSIYKHEYHPTPHHMFIDIQILAEAPVEYLRAGIGDGLSKELEVEFAARGGELSYLPHLGVGIARTCNEKLLAYGEEALRDCAANKASEAIREVALVILVSTGYVSNLESKPGEYYYNTSIAHLFYYGSTTIKRRGHYLHGDVVAFGILVLLAFERREDALLAYLNFYKKTGLPTTLSDLGLREENLDALLNSQVGEEEWEYAPVPFTVESLKQSILRADEAGNAIK